MGKKERVWEIEWVWRKRECERMKRERGCGERE